MTYRREKHPLDGVNMKITLKPPKSINISQQLMKVVSPSSLECDYDFTVEKRVLEEVRAKKAQGDKLKTLCPTSVCTLKQDSVPFGVLTPSQPKSPSENEEPVNNGSRNISVKEFESEAYSPFDQVELQTLNDIEELHSIFNKLESSSNQHDTTKAFHSDTSTNQISNRSLDEQHSKIERIGSAVPINHCNNPSLEKSSISALPTSLQPLAGEVISMGFQEERVVSAIIEFGADKGKIVENLCSLQTLIDEGFSYEDAVQALQYNDHDLKKSKEFLAIMKQFLALGFHSKDIATALKANDNNKDKALDDLLQEK